MAMNVFMVIFWVLLVLSIAHVAVINGWWLVLFFFLGLLG